MAPMGTTTVSHEALVYWINVGLFCWSVLFMHISQPLIKKRLSYKPICCSVRKHCGKTPQKHKVLNDTTNKSRRLCHSYQQNESAGDVEETHITALMVWKNVQRGAVECQSVRLVCVEYCWHSVDTSEQCSAAALLTVAASLICLI